MSFTLLSEAPVRGSGQSPDSGDRKWNSYSISKSVDWLIVKSCGFTTRKADESGTVAARKGRSLMDRPFRHLARALRRCSPAWRAIIPVTRLGLHSRQTSRRVRGEIA